METRKREIKQAIARLEKEYKELEATEEKDRDFLQQYKDMKRAGYTDGDVMERFGVSSYYVQKRKKELKPSELEAVYYVYHGDALEFTGTRQEIRLHYWWAENTFISNRTPSRKNKTLYRIYTKKELEEMKNDRKL